ncbi:MAG: transcription antitermination factor NusB [bacterium]
MNIKQRINARKVILSYFYQHCFFCSLIKKDKELTDVLFVDYVFKTDKEKFTLAKDELITKLQEHDYLASEEECKAFVGKFFDDRTDEDVDYDYIIRIALALPMYEKELIAEVNTYTVSFSYEEMDTIDQAIFLLGYIENKILQTPKEVLLNEMIELAKRYSDE